MYLLKTFKCHDRLHIYILECMFCGLIIMSSKSLVSISLKSSLSFMFDDFDTINLIPRQICLHCIMLNTKNGNQ
jgi:hypothetical protein